MASLLARRRAPRAAVPDPPVVYRWDLDKTYLKSEFESLRELVKIPFEKAADKIAAPGVTALLRNLRETAMHRSREVHVYFISASPPQIGRAIREKLALDGVVHDGIVFKDQLQRLMRGKFRHLREQVGYKVTELLKARSHEPWEAREYLFGDDWESDPLIYSLYADVLAGRVGPGELSEILLALRVDRPLVEEARALAAEVEQADAVGRIFINLERRTPPASFRSFGARLVPTFNYFQTAVCLFEEHMLDEGGVEQVARSLIDDSAYSPERLANSLADIQRRGHLGAGAAMTVREHLRARHLLPMVTLDRRARWRLWWHRARTRWRLAPPPGLAAPVVSLDYRALIAGARAPEAHPQ